MSVIAEHTPSRFSPPSGAPTGAPDHRGGRPAASPDPVGGVVELADAPSDWLGEEVISLARHLAGDTYALLRLVGEIDARGAFTLWGALSCAAWLADVCDIERSTARSQVRVARAMRAWPTLDAAMANGDLSFAKARVLVPHLSDDNVAPLVDIATTTPAGRLGTAVAAWLHRHDGPDAIEARQHADRSASWRTEPDGMVTVTARLEPAVAGAVCAVIDQQVMVTPAHLSDPDAPAGAPGASETCARRSLAQQRADALATIFTATPNPTGAPTGRVDTEVLIHVTADGHHLTDGTPIGDHAVTRLLPDAYVSLLIHDNQRRPIDASPRRRFPTRRQRRVLDAREAECAHPGCHATAFLQYDHIQPYPQGGPTILANLRRLCGPHNRARARNEPTVPAPHPARIAPAATTSS